MAIQQSATVHGTTQTFFATIAEYEAYNAANVPVRPGTVVMDASSLPATFLGISDGAGGLSGGAADGSSVVVIDPSAAPWNVSKSTPDATATIQAIINILHTYVAGQIAAGLHAYGMVLVNDLFNISSLTVPGTVSLIGRSSSETGFLQIPGTVPDMITVTPYQGVLGGLPRQQYFIGLRVDGQGNGNIPFTAVTDGSTAVLSVTGAQLVQPGYIIEAIGIPKNDASGAMGLVTAASKTTNQITLSTPTVGANNPYTKAVARVCVTQTCTADGTTATMLCSNTTGIVVGMKCYGANLQVDSNDLNQWSIVKAVVPNFSVTLDRVTASAGSFACQFYVGPCGFRLVEENQAPNYNSNLQYEGICFSDVRITNQGYHGLVNRSRNQMHIWASGLKTDSCGGYGFVQTGASDTWCDHLLTGNNWWAAADFVACATPRWKGEYYDTYLHDRYAEVMVRGCRYWHMENSDINGNAYVTSSNNTTHGIAQISNCNFLVNNSRIVLPTPWGLPSAYVTCNGSGTVLQVSGSTFAADDQAVVSNNSRYNYLASSQNGGLIYVTGQSWADFPTSGLDNCPYSIAPCDVMSNFFATYVRVDQLTYQGWLTQRGNVGFNDGYSLPGNGAYEVALVSGGSYAVPTNTNINFLAKASANSVVATYTLNLPDQPNPGEYHTFACITGITALSWNLSNRTGYAGTSTTSVPVQLGTTTLATGVGKSWLPGGGQRVLATSTGSGATMTGITQSFDNKVTGNLVFVVDAITGSGTHNDWSLTISIPMANFHTLPSTLAAGATLKLFFQIDGTNPGWKIIP